MPRELVRRESVVPVARPTVLFRADGTAYPLEPGAPPPPVMNPGTPARSWVPGPQENLVSQPRYQSGVRLTSFQQLRALATYDLVAIAISDVMGQILGMDHEFRVRKEYSKQKASLQAKVDRVRETFRYPYPPARQSFRQWLSRALYDVLVIDALTICPRRNAAGELLGLQIIDGATIKPFVDARGEYPQPPDFAFGQYAHGQIETFFTLDELFYSPMNQRSFTPYGMSPVERVLMTVNCALRHDIAQLEFHTSGTIPDSIFSIDADWTPEQLEDFEKNWNLILEGRADLRSGRTKFMPKGTWTATKPAEFSYDQLEWFGRIVSWAFGVSPVPIAKQQNRSTAGTLEESSLESGPRPIAEGIADAINWVLAYVLDAPEIELAWGDDETEDPKVVIQRQDVMLGKGAITLNEVRSQNGQEPYPKEYGDRPFIVVGADVVFLDQIEELQAQKAAAAEAAAQALAQGPQGVQTSAKGDGKSDAEEPVAKLQEDILEEHQEAIRSDLLKCRRKALSALKDGKDPVAVVKSFRSESIPPATRKRLEEAISC